MDKLSVIVPVFNEEGNINQLFYEIKYICSWLIGNKSIKDYDIIIVNDGSTDRMQLILENLKASEKPCLKL